MRLIYLQKTVRPKKLDLFDNWTFISAVILHMNIWKDLIKVADRFCWLRKEDFLSWEFCLWMILVIKVHQQPTFVPKLQFTYGGCTVFMGIG